MKWKSIKQAFAMLLGVLSLSSGLLAQGPPPPPGYVLVDDMYLPAWVTVGDAVYDAPIWPGGVMPYTFAANMSAANQAIAMTAMAEWEAVSGVSLIPRTNQADYIVFNDSGAAGGCGCNNSSVGRVGGAQTINFVSWGTKYRLVHEIMHAAGFLHEQSRTDRDTYVTINSANISQTQCSGNPCNGNFAKVATSTSVGTYDFESIMHYGADYFSSNGLDTITCKPAYAAFQTVIGNRVYMTTRDALGMANRYGAAIAPTITSLSQTYSTSGASSLTISVYGTRFFEGSSTASGVQGTRVKFSGTTLATTYVNPSEVSAIIPTSLLDTAGCFSITVENAYPGGGTSTAVDFTVGPTGSFRSYYGSQENARLGTAVCGIGDATGDGIADYVLCEPFFDNGGSASAGRAYLINGATGALVWTATGSAGYELGTSCAAVGDLTGDGVPDVAVGCPGYSSNRGFVRLLNGATGASFRSYLGVTATTNRFGAMIAAGGDIDGDGVNDIVASGPSGTGYVEVLSGASTTIIRTHTGVASELFGDSLAAGDLNGDGRADYAVGAPGAAGGGTSRGRVVVYNGSSGAVLSTINGSADNDDFGESLAMVPCVNDTAIGNVSLAIGADQSAIGNGFVRVYSYRITTVLPLIVFGMSLDFTINGPSAGSDFGECVSNAGDLDGDGFGDIAVGAPTLNTVSVFAANDRRLLASWSGSGTFGSTIDYLGDSDDDGLPELLIGAPTYTNSTCALIGAAYVREQPVPPSRRKLMISEVSFSPVAAVELVNLGGGTVNLANYSIRTKIGGTTVTTDLSASSLSLLSKGVAVVSPTGSIDFAETPPASPKIKVLPPGLTIAAGFSSSIALIHRSGVVVDEVHIPSTGGAYTQGALGGMFRGLAPRSGSPASIERIWGLDSNSGGDWTSQSQTSMGLENRSSGPRGTDPVALADLVINEVDDSPDYIELRLRSGGFLGIIDGTNYELEIVNIINSTPAIVRPWKGVFSPIGEYVVLGDNVVTPAELPAPPFAQVPNYADLSAVGESLTLTADEQAITLYDNYGRALDVVRTNWRLSTVNYFVCNQPRSASHWSSWGGAVNRQIGGDGSYGRTSVSTDTNTATDWYNQITRSMGSDNGATFGALNFTDLFDVRVNDGQGAGIALILNAGSSMSGKKWSILISPGPGYGNGPLMGLQWSAINNWVALYNDPFLSGVLDANGSARFDYPSGLVPTGLAFDLMFILQNVGDPGSLLMQTPVLQLNT